MAKSAKKKIIKALPVREKKPKNESKDKSKKEVKKSKPVSHKKDPIIFKRIILKHRANVEKSRRRHAERKAKLPKNPVKRFFAKLNPAYWSTRHFWWVVLKVLVALALLATIAIAGLFIYFKNELKEIELSGITISETVNTYLDRNGVVLWEDVGDEDYRLVVEGSEISTYMRQATVAIEDKNFYNHAGVDFSALIRALIATTSGQGVQGGSTLTQQLIKQVYFSDEASSEDRGGISRKIKELILALELEKMYDKEQIITMYLNESPYGGRRNGVESAAQTYFGKAAKDLDLAESALLAAIPNNPAVLDPYNEASHEALVARQQKTLDAMAELGYITTEEAEEAKAIDILATIRPEASQYANIKAPHFVLEVKKQLEEKYGISTMRAGGFTITTTLDYTAQQIAEESVRSGYDQYAYLNDSDNAALVSLDVETSQVIAMVGSLDYNIPGYGEVNVTTSALEPGSTIKPVLDYTPLFMQREGLNYGPGTILKDENIDSIYCAGAVGSCYVRNYTGSFYGNVTIRKALSNSLNIPAIKALYINGIENSLEVAHALGDKNYCAESGNTAGLSMAIGSGCTVIPVEHANAYATLARGGSYKDIVYVLEVKNSSGDVLEAWEDTEGTRVVDDQVAYLISNILSDAAARASLVFGSQAYDFGFVIPGVWTASKTGTTTTQNSAVTKDQWIISYSTALSTVVWNGNHDGSGLSSSSSNVSRRIMGTFMERVHKELYGPSGRWAEGSEPARPAGIHTATVNGITDIWPSWYDASKNSGVSKETIDFNKFTYKKAAACTPDSYRISIEVTKTTDPMTGNPVYSAPEPYDAKVDDDCSYTYVAPTVSATKSGSSAISINITPGSETIKSYTVYIDGEAAPYDGSNTYNLTGKEKTFKITVSDGFNEYSSETLTLKSS